MAGNSDEQAELTRRLKMVIAAVTEATEHIDSPDIDRRAKAAISSCKACQAASETVFPGVLITTGDGRDGGLDAAGEQRLREELLGRTRAWRCRGSQGRGRMATSGMASHH